MNTVSLAQSPVVPVDRYSTVLHELEVAGYGEFLSAFTPHLIGTHGWPSGRDNASDDLRLIIDLLLLGRKVAETAVKRVVPSIGHLVDDGIMVVDDGRMYLPSLGLVCFLGLWLFVQRPRRNPVIYIGHDTFALTARIRPRGIHSALDLCSGPGTQGLYVAARGVDVTAVECNVIAAEVARINAEVNGLSERFKVCVGNLYDALPSDAPPFDLITANPPLLPFPEDHFYPFVGHGGADGLAVTWRILQGLPRWLAPAGQAQIIGTCFSDGYLPCAIDGLRTAAGSLGLDIKVCMVGHALFARGTHAFEGLSYTAAQGAQASKIDSIRDALERISSEAGATHLCYFSLTVHFGKGKVDVLDLGDDRRQTLWFAD